MKTADDYDRLEAAVAIWKIEQKANVAVPALIEALNGSFLPIRREAATALGEIGPPASAAIPALIAARDHKPKQNSNRVPSSSEGPMLREMPEDEFYPQVVKAVVKRRGRIEPRGGIVE